MGHKQELQALVEATVTKWGQIDIVVGNAATNPSFGPSIDTPDEVFEKVIHTNLLSNVWLCNMTLPAMAARRGRCGHHRLFGRRPGGQRATRRLLHL